MEKILVGSRAFFGSYEDFRSKDYDFLELIEEPVGFEWRHEQSLRGVCTLKHKKESPKKMIERTLKSGDALLIGKFLVPEVAKAIGAKVKDILPLEELLPKLDKKHQYVATIFKAVKKNKKFELSQEQRDAAYEVYKAARVANENKEDE